MNYLDNAATTFPKPDEVLDAVDKCQRNYAVNVGRGSYPLASYAAKMVDETRALLADMVNAAGLEHVVFTASATIAANEIILGLPWDAFKTVYVSPFEHNAIARPLSRMCALNGVEMKFLPFDSKTQQWDMEETKRMFVGDPPDYVFINHISNVTGLILPIDAIAQMAKQYGACIVVDAAQSLGLVDINIQKTPIDYLIFAGHKNLYASWGIGGFVSNNDTLVPVLSGGTGADSLNLTMSDKTPVGFEVGSPNIIAIASLNASIQWLNTVGMDVIASKKGALMRRLIEGMRAANITLYLPGDAASHTSVLSFNVEGYAASEVGTILGEDYDIATRTGFHCAPFIHRLLDTEKTLGTVRLSLGYYNSEEDVDAVVKAIAEL